MEKTIGVISPLISREFSNIKKYLLAFDELAILEPEMLFKALNTKQEQQKIDEIEWLMSRNLLFDAGEIVPQPSPENYKILMGLSREYKINLLMGLYTFEEATEIDSNQNVVVLQNGTKLEETTIKGFDFYVRAKSIWLRIVSSLNAFPILTSSINFETVAVDISKSNVLQTVIKFLPIPSDETPWEQIIEFKNDNDSKSKYLALKNWINETARGELPLNEIEEKLEYLLDQYEKQVQLHKMKYHKGILETLVMTTAEVAENLAKLKFSKIAQLAFSMKNRKLSLMEEEMKAPGKEVAYISKAREKFPN